jgi:endonuclease/exonuclease/phosphatase family metal-dependent hydrolase
LRHITSAARFSVAVFLPCVGAVLVADTQDDPARRTGMSFALSERRFKKKRMLRRISLGAVLVTTLLFVLVACQAVRNSAGPALVPKPENALRIASYNVHYIILGQQDGRWSEAAWQGRREPLDAVFKAIDADVIAFQEMESFSRGSDGSVNLARDWLLSRNPGYAAGASGDWRAFPSTQPIFYRSSRLNLLDQGWFFFSDTPEVIYSRTFDGSYPAFASWAVFLDRSTGQVFRVVNLHTDYASRDNQRKSIALVAERVAPWIVRGESVFVVGDLNARLGSSLHRMLEDAGLTFVPVEGATYHFDRGLNLFGAIDHISYSGVRPLGPPIVYRERPGDIWPTDHYPLVADFTLSR